MISDVNVLDLSVEKIIKAASEKLTSRKKISKSFYHEKFEQLLAKEENCKNEFYQRRSRSG